MADFSGLGDSASAICFSIEESGFSDTLPSQFSSVSEDFIANLPPLGPALVDYTRCRSEENQVWFGDGAENAYFVSLGPMRMVAKDSIDFEVAYFVAGDNGAWYQCRFVARQRVWILRECVVTAVS